MIRNIAALGAGTIGRGVALHFAIHGYCVRLYDPSETACETARAENARALSVFERERLIPEGGSGEILARVRFMPTLEAAVQGADYVLESVTEDLPLKEDVFCALERLCPDDAIFGTNTSSLRLSDITKKMSASGKARSMMCHWFNPGHILPLVELSFFGNMREKNYDRVAQLYRAVEKRPVRVLKDVPGLIANRIQHAVARETLYMLSQGIADARELEDAMRFGPAFRYAATGPLSVMDFGGLDVWCRVEDNLLPALDARTDANPMLRERAAAGKCGVKSGEGFFQYPDPAEARRTFELQLIRQLTQISG